MAVNPVPLAIGGGAVHDDDVIRRMINGLSRDSHGVALPGDLKVTQTATASGTVNVAPGGVILRNHGQAGQSYYGDAPTVTGVSSGLTTAGYHMIVARVIDPQYAPWQPSGTQGAPNTSVANGPYFQLHVVTGVPSTARTALDAGITYTAEPLALISNPTGAGAITNAMIDSSVRRLAQPRFWSDEDDQKQSSTNYVLVSETAFHQWPVSSFQTDVPDWATEAFVRINFSFKVNGPADVNMRVVFGNLVGGISEIDYNAAPNTPVPGNVEVLSHRASAKLDVRSLQGQRVTVRPDARRVFPENVGEIWSEATQQISFEVRYYERVV